MFITEIFNTVQNPNYPQVASSDWVICYVADLNDRDDPYEGPVPEHIAEFDEYKLVALPVSETNALEQNHDPSLASEYASLAAETAPPIVFDAVQGEIIDGFHRVHAALLRGDTTIMAYVGVRHSS